MPDPAPHGDDVTAPLDGEVAVALQDLCRGLVAEAGFNEAAVTLMGATDDQAVVAVSSSRARWCHDLEFDAGEGPEHDAFARGRPVLVPDLERMPGRWVGYTPRLLGAGVHAVFSCPLQVGAARVGVLTCYSDQARVLTAEETGDLFDRAAAVTDLLLSEADSDARTQGQAVLDSTRLRSEVYQAQGMVTAQLDVGLAEAMARIRAYAFAHDLDLTQLAQDIVDGTVVLPTLFAP